MLSSFIFRSAFLNMSCSTTSGHVLPRAAELRRVVSTISVSLLEAELEATPVEHFPESHGIVERYAC
jgi:hypothetical protein